MQSTIDELKQQLEEAIDEKRQLQETCGEQKGSLKNLEKNLGAW